MTLDPFNGFSRADTVRTFWVELSNLKIFRNWRDRSEFSEFATSDVILENAVDGHGKSFDVFQLLKDGRQGNDFKIIIGVDDRKWETWKIIKENSIYEQLHTDIEMQRQQSIIKICDKNPPTVHLTFWDRDDESAIDEGFTMILSIHEAVFKQLESDLILRRINTIRVGIEWIAGLIRDVHAPLAESNVWAVPKRKFGHETLYGYVKSMRWDIERA